MIGSLRGMSYEERSRLINGYSMLLNFSWALVKLGVGLALNSGHLMAGGLYSCVIGFAKLTYFASILSDVAEKPRYAMGMGVFIVLSGGLYMVYIEGMLALPRHFGYSPGISLVMALFSVAEVCIAVRGLRITRKLGDEMLGCLKCVSLAGTVPALVLTRISINAILTDFHFVIDDFDFGAHLSAAAVIIGVYVIYRGMAYDRAHKL